MPTEQSPGKPTTRRYSDAEKDQAVRLVCKLREELGTEQGMLQRVARQLGYGVESVRLWVRERDVAEGVVGPDAKRAYVRAWTTVGDGVRVLHRRPDASSSAPRWGQAVCGTPRRSLLLFVDEPGALEDSGVTVARCAPVSWSVRGTSAADPASLTVA